MDQNPWSLNLPAAFPFHTFADLGSGCSLLLSNHIYPNPAGLCSTVQHEWSHTWVMNETQFCHLMSGWSGVDYLVSPSLFPNPQNENASMYLRSLLWRLNKTMHVIYLAQLLAYSKGLIKVTLKKLNIRVPILLLMLITLVLILSLSSLLIILPTILSFI